MKKHTFILLTFIMLLFSTCGYCNILDGLFKGMISAKVADEVSAVKSEINGKVDSEVNGIKGDVSLMKGRIDKLAEINTNLRLRVEAQNKQIAGYQNQINEVKNEIKSGRDSITNSNNTNTVVNDGSMINKLVSTVLNVITSGYTYIIGLLVGIIKLQSNQINDARKKDDEFRSQQEESQQKYIKTLEAIAFKTMGIDVEKVKKDGN